MSTEPTLQSHPPVASIDAEGGGHYEVRCTRGGKIEIANVPYRSTGVTAEWVREHTETMVLLPEKAHVLAEVLDKLAYAMEAGRGY